MNIETEQQIILDPYIGPRPFKRDIEDQKRFFGRDDETDEIVSLILGHKIVLIYAQSGTGKTSIFNAQVAPTLEKYGFQVLPTARVGIASDTKSDFNSLNMNSSKISSSSSSSSFPRLINSYMLNALQSLKPEIDSKSLLTRSLSSFLKDYFPLNHSNKNNKIKAQVLVFDQLEELFNFYPGSTWRKQQEDFFEQITEALEENPSLRIVLVIREDYLAELDHFTKILPGRLRARYRLERLGKNAALLAIKGPLRAIKTKSGSLNAYSEQEIDNQIQILVEELLKIHVEDPFTGKPQQLNGEFVEPIQLQIVSQRWWQEISSGRPQTTQARLQALADVDSALQEFYEDSVYDAVKNTNICQGIVRKLFEEKLITSTGTRAFVHWGAFAQFIQGANKSISKEKVDEVINILEKKYLIRGEWRSGAKWYELTHDRLIGPIKASNLKWKERERSRKSRRNRMIIIPSLAVAAAAIAVSVIVFFYLNPFTDSEEILLGRTPSEISVIPETNMIYVSTSDNNPISIIDGKTNEVVDDITLDQPASDISVNPETNMIYAAGYNSSSRSSDSIYVMDGKTLTMVDDISVDKNIIDLSVNPETNMIYAVGTNSSSFSDSIYVMDGKTNEVVDDIILLNKINSYISINPQTNMIYAVGYNSSSFSNSVSVIDGKTNEVVVDDITLDQPAYEISDQPAYEISVNPETNMIYVAVSDFVYVIDGKTNEVIDNVTLEQPAKDISVNPETNMIYVAVSDSVYVIDGKTLTTVVDVSVDKNIIYLSVNPETNMIYVSDSDSNTVYTINGILNRIDAIVRGPEPPGIKVGKEPSEISVNPETNMIYVSTSDNNAISIIDGKTNEVDTIRVNKPSYISVNPQTNMIYAVGYNSSSFSNSIYVIDGKTNEVVDNITLDQPAYEISVNPETNMIYALGTNFSSFSNSVSVSVSVIDGKTNEVVDNITLDQPASEISVNPETNMIYAAGSGYISSYGIGSGSVSIIDGKTNEVVDNITLDQPASDISVNPETNMIYAAVSDLGFVYVIDGKTNEVVVDNITLDQPASEISVNPETNMIYAAGSGYISSYDIGSGSVSIIDGKTNEVDDITLTHVASSEYIDVNPKTNVVYTVSSTSDSVTAINGTTHQIITKK
jgi:DNA-binding beta-propeller fold protein YncE